MVAAWRGETEALGPLWFSVLFRPQIGSHLPSKPTTWDHEEKSLFQSCLRLVLDLVLAALDPFKQLVRLILGGSLLQVADSVVLLPLRNITPPKKAPCTILCPDTIHYCVCVLCMWKAQCAPFFFAKHTNWQLLWMEVLRIVTPYCG